MPSRVSTPQVTRRRNKRGYSALPAELHTPAPARCLEDACEAALAADMFVDLIIWKCAHRVAGGAAARGTAFYQAFYPCCGGQSGTRGSIAPRRRRSHWLPALLLVVVGLDLRGRLGPQVGVVHVQLDF